MAEFTTQTVLEAALLAARKPLSIREMRRLFSDELSAKTVRQELESLRVRIELWCLRNSPMALGGFALQRVQ